MRPLIRFRRNAPMRHSRVGSTPSKFGIERLSFASWLARLSGHNGR